VCLSLVETDELNGERERGPGMPGGDGEGSGGHDGNSPVPDGGVTKAFFSSRALFVPLILTVLV